MVDIKSYSNGQFSWADLQTPSVDGAKKFYSSLFGWDMSDMPTPMGSPYTICTMRGQPIVGMGAQPPDMKGAPAIWSTYVNVDSVDAIATKVTSNGGKVVVPAMDVMTQGRMMMLQDPTGAMLGCWQPKDHRGAGIQKDVGTLSWFELMTTDVAAAKKFYSAVFGWIFKDSNDVGMPYSEILSGTESQGGMMAMPPNLPKGVPPCWMPYFTVKSAAATCAKATELGGKVMMPPTPIPNVGTFAVVSDGQGGTFDVIEMTAK